MTIIHSSSVSLLNHENTGLAVEIAFLSSLQAEIYAIPVAAILDFPLPVSSSLTVQHYHYPYLIVGENIGIVVGISLLSCVRAEIYVIEV